MTIAMIDRQVLTGSGVWTKPSGAVFCDIILCAGGGGGGSGAVAVNTLFRTGGNAAGGGVCLREFFEAGALGSTESYVVGTGGAGGLSISSAGGAGNIGIGGGNSNFGTKLWAQGGLRGSGGISNAGDQPNSGQALDQWDNNSGLTTQTLLLTTSHQNQMALMWKTAGGGGGGGMSSANALRNVQDPKVPQYLITGTAIQDITSANAGVATYYTTQAAQIAPTTDGASPSLAVGIPLTLADVCYLCLPSYGGCGAMGSIVGNGGTGGAAQGYGAGGGGGGAATTGVGASGAGGNGTDGVLVVTTYGVV